MSLKSLLTSPRTNWFFCFTAYIVHNYIFYVMSLYNNHILWIVSNIDAYTKFVLMAYVKKKKTTNPVELKRERLIMKHSH